MVLTMPDACLNPILDLTKRPRRNRKSPAIRALVQENRLDPSMFVAPLFVMEGTNQQQPVNSMPGVNRLSIDLLVKEASELYQLGIPAVELFPVIPQSIKDRWGSEAVRSDNLLFRAIEELKASIPDLCVMTDIALDPFTDHGHDGLVDEQGRVLNDETVEVLAQMSVLAAAAGADVVAPSDMMDGRISHIRKQLDTSGYSDVSILAYAAKYASAFYGPFREALNSTLKFGDKKSYQMNPANRREALLEVALDEAEGADMLLIKPALPYLDVIAEVRRQTNLPLGAYHVSGEYAMVMAAGQNGWLDTDRALHESLLSIKRAGVDFIFTYAARRMAEVILR